MSSSLPPRITYEALQKKLQQLEVQKNRITASLNEQHHHQQKVTKSDRNKRTRTLIQLGGLVKLSGLMAICDIDEGNDLQDEFCEMDKAATLLGILMTCVENMRTDLNLEHMEAFKEKGIRALKMSPYYTR
ncbi:conjugal transfer protein TraD [Candidatus Odyssella thessalonicensis]|uniref:conjugal transfer protein TraD n=1 Tax=Candidatus Odyssella thessalonicensis TaxID=84647 RepID=UPI000225A9F5|nr:conjugal transfer protein TraD [Candidatus Odyssella thessalonicensis]